VRLGQQGVLPSGSPVDELKRRGGMAWQSWTEARPLWARAVSEAARLLPAPQVADSYLLVLCLEGTGEFLGCALTPGDYRHYVELDCLNSTLPRGPFPSFYTFLRPQAGG